MLQDFRSAILTDPLFLLIFLGITGMIVWKYIGPHRSNLRLIVQIAFFVAMSAVLVLGHIPLGQTGGSLSGDKQSLFVVLAQILWWLHLSWAVIGFVRIYLVLEGRPREARLLQDIVVGGVYLCVTLSALAFVFGLPVGTLIATSGVIAIALGLALQNTLGDVFSGIALTLGRTFTLGDWIRINDGMEGRVVASTWRSTQILTIANNVVVLPNSSLAKLGLTNISRPSEAHLLQLTVRVKPTRAPAMIEDIMKTALTGGNSIMRNPPPFVALKGIDANAVEVDLYARVKDPMRVAKARNEIIDLVHRHCLASGLLLAPSTSSVVFIDRQKQEEFLRVDSEKLAEFILHNPIFEGVDGDETKALAEASTTHSYAPGALIARHEQITDSIMVVASGVAAVWRDGDEQKRLSPGDFFGGIGLAPGTRPNCSIRAVSNVKVFELGTEKLATLLRERPDLASHISAKLSEHVDDNRPSGDADRKDDNTPHALLRSIRTIFTN